MMRRRELNLVRRAIRERWPIPKAERRKLIQQLIQVAHHSDDPRSVIAAIKALIEADRLNLEQERREAEELERQLNQNQDQIHIREVVVRTRDEAHRLLSLPEAGGVPGGERAD